MTKKQDELRILSTERTEKMIGADNEVTRDRDRKTLVYHDGKTRGGFPIGRVSDTVQVIEDLADLKALGSVPGKLKDGYRFTLYRPGYGQLTARWDASSTATANDVNVIAATGVSTGRFIFDDLRQVPDLTARDAIDTDFIDSGYVVYVNEIGRFEWDGSDWNALLEPTIHLKQFLRGVADESPNIYSALTAAQGAPIDVTGCGLVPWLDELPDAISDGVHFICSDSVSGFTGYNGTGLRVSGGHIRLVGIRIEGFNDGTDQNKTNYDAVMCRVNTGTSLTDVVLHGVKVDGVRSVVSAGGESDDFTPDVTISTELLSVQNSDIRNSSIPVNWRALCERDVCKNNEYRNVIGAGRIVVAHKCYVDGLGFDNASYAECKNHEVSGNYFDTIVNRTTTGDSTTGNNYECHAIMLSGYQALIHDNTIIDCTGNVYDCEGIYTKVRHQSIHDNILIDGGGEEAAINVKGINADGNAASSSPFGDRGGVRNNLIVFTRYSYDNDGTVVDLTGTLSGIHVSACNNTEVTENFIFGADNNDIRINGHEDSDNRNCSVTQNKSYQFRGANSILWRGAFKNPVCESNECHDPVMGASLAVFRMINFLSVADRGNSHRNTKVKNNTLTADVSDGRFDGKIIALAQFDAENYSFDGIETGGNTWDVVEGSATPDVRIYYVTSQTGSPAGNVSNITATKDFIKQSINVTPWFWGNPTVLSYSIEAEILSTVDNTTITALQVPTVADKMTSFEIKTSFSTSTDGETGTRWRIGNYYDSSGTATQDNQADIYSYRSAPTGEASINVSGKFVRLRVAEGGTAEITAKSIVKASTA